MFILTISNTRICISPPILNDKTNWMQRRDTNSQIIFSISQPIRCNKLIDENLFKVKRSIQFRSNVSEIRFHRFVIFSPIFAQIWPKIYLLDHCLLYRYSPFSYTHAVSENSENRQWWFVNREFPRSIAFDAKFRRTSWIE